MIEDVDPFIGTETTQLAPPSGLAATWWWPKPQVGNTHPGPTYPMGMVSACAYSGGYPTGYGTYDLSLEGVPEAMVPGHPVAGFSHFQQSGTGAIRKYYNYFRVTPMIEPLDVLDRTWEVVDEQATPGYYRAELENGIVAELTVGPKSAIHRYTFPKHQNARVVVDVSRGGLKIPYGATIPLRAHIASLEQGCACGGIDVEGVPLSLYLECDAPGWRQLLWYDRRLMPGGTRLDFDHIRPTTLRPFGLMWAGPAEAGTTIELRIGFSLRGTKQAAANLHADCEAGEIDTFDARRAQTEKAWRKKIAKISIEEPRAQRREVFSTALYHSLIKPSMAMDESPWWSSKGAFVFDISTMWDIYRTQLPLLTALAPKHAVALANALITIAEEEGNFPIGYRMARGSDRFSRQGSALAHTFLADLCRLDAPGIDWEWALIHMANDLRRTYGEEFLRHGITHPVSHTLDLAYGNWCTAVVARRVGDFVLAEQLESLSARWINAFDPATGLLVDSNFYEGTKYNYSFRLLQDMDARIAVSGGDTAFVAQLDKFFGFGAEPVTQPGIRPSVKTLAEGAALGRFEGLNNEPDMEAPWSYYYAGRPDRTAEIVYNVITQAFGSGRGGLPGNDDSGGLSSWYVWAALGMFPVAGQAIVLLGPPAFREQTMRFGKGTVTISTDGFVPPVAGGDPQYVQGMLVDGEPLQNTWLPLSRCYEGVHIHVKLGPTPSDWGRSIEHRPPSWAPAVAEYAPTTTEAIRLPGFS